MGSESKRTYDVKTPGKVESPQENPSAVPLVGISEDNATIVIAGRDVALNEIVMGAFETAGVSVLEWNALEAEARDELIADKRKELQALFRDAGVDLPAQDATRRAAQAAVAARKAAREANPGVAASDRPPTLPHRDDVDPNKIAAPVLTQQGWVVSNIPRSLPSNFR